MDFYFTAILQGACLSMMVVGIFITMKIFNIPDITTDGSYTLGAAVTAVLLSKNFSPIVVLPLAIFSGMLAGAVTGIIHTRLKVHPLLAGILVMTGLYSVNLAIMGRSNIPLIQVKNILQILPIQQSILQQGLMIFVFVLISIVFLGWLLKTDFGLSMRATGSSESMIRALGVNTASMKIAGLALANGFTAFSGYLMAQFQGFSDINMGIGIVIAGLGAVAMGDTFVQKIQLRNIFGILTCMVLGSIVFQLALALALDAGIDAAWLKFMTASIVLLIVSLSKFKLAK